MEHCKRDGVLEMKALQDEFVEHDDNRTEDDPQRKTATQRSFVLARYIDEITLKIAPQSVGDFYRCCSCLVDNDVIHFQNLTVRKVIVRTKYIQPAMFGILLVT